MLNWLLIVSITMVSTTMLVFVSAYLAILPETGAYYQKDQSDILLLSNSFNILYLIVTPLIFSSLKKHYSLLVYASIFLTGVGCIGRYLCFDNYSISLVMSILVAIGHIPIITAPYGLLDLFPQTQRGYAASIPLFVPTLGINFSIIYGMTYIASQFTQNLNFTKHNQINKLNLIIAIMGAISSSLSFFCMFKFSKKIKQINEDLFKEQDKSLTFFQSVKKQFKGGKPMIVMLFCWGAILGINWTYGGMFGVFLNETGLTHKDIALVGLFANLSSVIFSNLGTWISNMFNVSNNKIILFLNLSGFVASLYMQGSSTLNSIILAIIILRAGFSSFVSLALIELSHCGPSVLLSAVFFYIANGSNLVTIYLVDLVQNYISLGIMSLTILICIVFVHIAQESQQIYLNLSHNQSSLHQLQNKKISNQCIQSESFKSNDNFNRNIANISSPTKIQIQKQQ